MLRPDPVTRATLPSSLPTGASPVRRVGGDCTPRLADVPGRFYPPGQALEIGGRRAPMGRIKLIHHINVQVSDRARTREWYERVLGAEFLDRGPALNKRQLQL